jgi:hypothetical protein
MQCPRCGHEAEGMARACSACGYMLPFSLRQLRQARDAQAAMMVEVDNPAGDAASDGHVAGQRSALPFGRPGPTHPLTRPTLQPIEGPAYESIFGLPAPLSHPQGPLAPAPPLPPMRPLPPLPEVSAPAGDEPLQSVPWSGPLVPRQQIPQIAGTTSMVAALNAGTLLKSGRYRLQQRFSAATTLGLRNEPEPPLYLASDLERPGARVLVQELPTLDGRPDQAAHDLRRAQAYLEQVGQHGRIPPVLDAFTERSRRFLVFQLPAGERLADVLREEGALPEDDVIQLGLRLLDILGALERATPSIPHGNISLDNIIVQPDGHIALVGFSPTILARGGGRVEHGAAGGVRGYMAPEQQRGQADVRSDLHAVAAVLYYAVTGQRPTGQSGWLYEPARHFNPGISQALEALLSGALRPAAAQRFQSVAQMRQALTALVPAGPPVAQAGAGTQQRRTAVTGHAREIEAPPDSVAALRATLEVPVLRPPRPRRRWQWVVLAVLLLAILFGAAALAYLRLLP